MAGPYNGASLGIPEAITSRKPNPEILPGIEDKYRDILNIDAQSLDLILYGLEKGMDSKDIAAQLPVARHKVEEVKKLVEITGHMREKSLGPDLDSFLSQP